MYEIVFTRRSAKDFIKLENETQKRIATKLGELSINPYEHSKKLSYPEIGSFRCRIGDYRVIFDIDRDKIIILRVGHRKDIYL